MAKHYRYIFTTILSLFIFCVQQANAKEYKASTPKEVSQLESKLQPGDILTLANGTWNDAELTFSASGTNDRHIVVRAETYGKVLLTGNSSLRLGGNYIDVFGLYFINGSTPDDVITFRTAKQVANNCRVSNCAIFNYNPSSRMKENNWIAFFGRGISQKNLSLFKTCS